MSHVVPLILTLQIDKDSQQFFDNKRSRYFPLERNFLAAHLTLFHQLPANDAAVFEVLNEVVSKEMRFTLEVSAIVSIGNGVAYKIESEQLQQLHKQLQQEWSRFLIPQDKQKLWPHITVQNKVDPGKAKLLQNELNSDFEPFKTIATGLVLWEYLNGPWRFQQAFNFASSETLQ